MKFTHLDDESVDTRSILSDIIGERIRLESKQTELQTSVKNLSTFWAKMTPTETEPVYDDKDNLVSPSQAIEVLYQFDPENQDLFIGDADIVDSAFAFVLDGVKQIYMELYESTKDSPTQLANTTGIEPPQNLVYNIQREKQGALSSIFQRYKEPEKDSPYYKMESTLAFVKLVEEVWHHLREHHEKSVAGVGVNFTMASRREGMESRCGIYRQYFLSWVKPTITKMMAYVVEQRIRDIVKTNERILQYQAMVQQRHEKQQMM